MFCKEVGGEAVFGRKGGGGGGCKIRGRESVFSEGGDKCVCVWVGG